MEVKVYKQDDRYFYQKQYYNRHKTRLNRLRTVNKYKKKFEFITTEEQIEIYKKNKKYYDTLKELDRNMLIEFLKLYKII